jgi:Spy/CpxP family protein refolding chaperone
MLYHRIARLAAASALLAVAAPLAAHAQDVTGNAQQAQVHGRRGPGHRMFADLNLTDNQKAQIKAIHEKYKDQFTAARTAAKPDFDAARAAKARGDTAAARASFLKARKAMAPIQQQEMTDIRNVLTDAQRQKLDAHKAAWKSSHGARKHAGA